MSTPEFDQEDLALQQALQTQEPPVPPTSVHQFAAAVRLRQEDHQPSFWAFHFPMTASAAAVVALFLSLQTEPTPAPQEPVVQWAELQIESNDETDWQGDIFDPDSLTEEVEIEDYLFADLEVSHDLQQQYEPAAFAALDDLDDEALERLDNLLNTALQNKGG